MHARATMRLPLPAVIVRPNESYSLAGTIVPDRIHAGRERIAANEDFRWGIRKVLEQSLAEPALHPHPRHVSGIPVARVHVRPLPVQLEAVDGGRNFEEAVLRAVNLGDRGRSGE
jgi:hypothetical protein